LPTCYAPVRRVSRPKTTPPDLHALGTPPALILSQDQTLHQDAWSRLSVRRPQDFCVSHTVCTQGRGLTPCPHHAAVAGLVHEQRHSVVLPPLRKAEPGQQGASLAPSSADDRPRPRSAPSSDPSLPSVLPACQRARPRPETISGPTRMPGGSSPVSTNPSPLGGSARNRARRAYCTGPALSRTWTPVRSACSKTIVWSHRDNPITLPQDTCYVK
jgi:hypothetical protein